ncbi:MAG: pyruvate:ferredoxin (flavodoxin) oxidoreductase [Clostridiales bacterium]|nr:pyruvate:ferredoxin (flavodoxin) oxidoreductase [Clostridiales bacterium]
MARKLKTMDGNNAAAHVAYAFTDVAAIYPITPSSTMAEYVDKWSANGQKNIFGQTVKVVEMQSEAGAAGAVHGSLLSGALTSTFTASQGLLLMIPNMYKWAAEQLPAVQHVSARTIATHALSIFGDQSDVMACRQTGVAMLASNSPQEAMDLGAVAHLSAIRGSMPFLHFFDGFRTSHEMQKIEVWNYDDLAEMIDFDALKAFRDRASNPNHPVLRGSAQNGDIFFQARESINGKYNALPKIVEDYMNMVNKKLGTDYKLFNYYGAPDAKQVVVAMGSACETAEEVVDYLNASGGKVGLVKVRLYRPFSVRHFLAALPTTVETIAVLDRTKEPGSVGEPLYLDVYSALCSSPIKVVGGRYGLSSKDTTPGQIIAAFRNIQSSNPKTTFTIGITDDVTNLSLPVTEEPDTTPKDIISCKFWGIGSDGTVGANKNSIKIIGDHTDLKVQAYFQYDSRKSGGVTISHLRFGKSPIKSTYYVSKANFVACHVPSYLESFDIAQDVKPGGVFLANTSWDVDELTNRLPAAAKKYIADNNVRFYTCDAEKIARELGLGNKTNAILQSAFFRLSEILPIDDAVRYMKKAVSDTYGRKGEDVVAMNNRAIDAGLESLVKIDVPASWKTPDADKPAPGIDTDREDIKKYYCNVAQTMNSMRGDKLPVSAFLDIECGAVVPSGTAAFEKRKIAIDVPCWLPENCIQCNQCSYVCPHSVIRPYALDPEEAKNAPEGMKMIPMIGKGNENRKFAILPTVFDCTGCGSCANVCPAKNKALVMKPLDTQVDQQKYFDYAEKHVSREKDTGFAPTSLKGSQFKKPLFEFPGACAGCGESPYTRLITQLYGDRMYIANATGCTSIWGGSAPTTPYTVGCDGKGPAWANSLFEDNAEFGFGMATGSVQRREGVKLMAEELQKKDIDARVKTAIGNWLAAFNEGEGSREPSKVLENALAEMLSVSGDFPFRTQLQALYDVRDQFVKPSVWVFGGDGWAYDIGYGGLDHVIASGQNINIMVYDTEVYSNTGGQASKATPTGAVALFAAAGKSVKKKDLAQIAMSYGYVYVAQISMGASQQQTLKAIQEAESYDGPSLIIAYAPCINHGIRAGMGKSQTEMKLAVESGYWNLLRYDPRLAAQGKNPLSIDSKAPTSSYNDFIMGEVRYSSLKLQFPERAEMLFAEAEKEANIRYENLVKQKEMLEPKQ